MVNYNIFVLKQYLNNEWNLRWSHVILSFNANAFNVPWYEFDKKIITCPFCSLYIYFLAMLLKVDLGTWHFVGNANNYMVLAINKKWII